MIRKSCVLALSLLVATVAFASNPVTPTTTLAAETGNNTSAATSFAGMPNGNIAASNVSKVSMKTLMYPGFNGKMYAHLMGWFGPTNHKNVGYSSATQEQVALQVNDMISRGYDGLILDWYGPSHGIEDDVAKLLAVEVPKHANFTWGLIEDIGALKTCINTSGCDVTAKFISDLNYAYTNYEQSPSYIKIGGRPVVTFFGIETTSTIDWTRVAANVQGNPIFVWRNSGGFTKPMSGGSFAWINSVSTDPTYLGLDYLDNFYAKALTYPTKSAMATGYKGFNDSQASWGKNRIMNQNCGQTWLTTMAETAKYYSATLDVYGVQIATWNDYEEGTEVESGIDNCVSISASMTGSTVSWAITGQENTLDHYTVFISPDGQNLMPVEDVPAGTHSLDLSLYSFDPGSYSVFVKAVGKPSIVNHMSAAAVFNVANQAPVAALTATPSSGIAPVAVTATTSGSYDVDGTIASTVINWGDGSTTPAASGSHTYTAAGNFTITVTVTDNNGATGTASTPISVTANQAPVVKLSVTPANGLAPVAASASTSGSYDPDGTIASTTINWGDGTTTASASGSHTYSTAGSYTITATAKDNMGATSSAASTITVTSNQAPVVKLAVTPTSGVAPTVVTASTSGSYDPDGTIASTVISWGDGTSTTATSGSHTYAAGGSYTIKVTVKDNSGASSTASATVTLTGGVTVSSPTAGASTGSPVHAVASAAPALASQPITAMKIYVDGTAKYSVSAAKLDTYVSMSKGTHTVTVSAWDSAGHVYKKSTSITVK